MVSSQVALIVCDQADNMPESMRKWVLPQECTRFDEKRLSPAMNLFIFSSAVSLMKVAGLLRSDAVRNLLRGVFVLQDISLTFLQEALRKPELVRFRHLVVHSSYQVPERIVFAWSVGAQDELIADADVVDDTLVVKTCAFDNLEVPFNSMPALSRMAIQDRRNFTIAKNGNYIHWPKYDIHIGVENIRQVVDPEWLARTMLRREEFNRHFGDAVAMLRKQAGLRQADYTGVSERHLRRIENGEFLPRIDTVRALARTHDLSANEYLHRLSTLVRQSERK